MLVENNKVVKVHYHGYFPDTREVFDSSLEREPLTFLVGHGQMIPGFEAEILGAGEMEREIQEEGCARGRKTGYELEN